MEYKQALIDKDPYKSGSSNKSENNWPCDWIACPDASEAPFVTAYFKRFKLDAHTKSRIHVTADERYELYLDGEKIGRGSECGDAKNWFYETYDLDLEAGEHCFAAKVWSLGDLAYKNQLTVHPGFLLSPQQRSHATGFGTGTSEWVSKIIGGHRFQKADFAFGIGATETIDAHAYDPEFVFGKGTPWKTADTLCKASSLSDSSHILKPRLLPPMINNRLKTGCVRFVANLPFDPSADPSDLDAASIKIDRTDDLPNEHNNWNILTGDRSVEIAPNCCKRVIIDLQDYYCAYLQLTTSQGDGSTIKINWSESLYSDNTSEGSDHYRYSKGNRDEIDGKYFQLSIGSTFRPNGASDFVFEPLWWRSGKFIEILVKTEQEPLVIKELKLLETRYPLDISSTFSSSDPRLQEIASIAHKTLQCCCHETFVDCPFYEQLMYAGDARLTALANYVTTNDDRLVRKAITMFDASRNGGGLTYACYPYRGVHRIPSFSLVWIAMVHDFAHWKTDLCFVEDRLPGVRQVIEYFLERKNNDGLIEPCDKREWGNFNFIDWVPTWDKYGIPDTGTEANSIFNWQFVLTLRLYAELEMIFNNQSSAQSALCEAEKLAGCLTDTFWVEEKGLFADDIEKTSFSEHAQCYAVLSDYLDPQKLAKVKEGLFTNNDLARATMYFSHYLFECCHKLGRSDIIFERLQPWFDLQENGFKTIYENPLPTRSDCHGWGTHILYHFFATFLGIRPASPSFESLTITPQLGPLSFAEGQITHPAGIISVNLKKGADSLTAEINLPEPLKGTFAHLGTTHPIKGKTVLTHTNAGWQCS